jgi:predicted ribosomally synthesized peptide with SipW-like signal peptide
MNKKILISLSTIAAIAMIIIGATNAYFSNTETSTGNIFTAGTLDLKIDNTCHYNEMVCVSGLWSGPVGGYPVAGTPCTCTWALKDLDGQAIFHFTDVKPGDDGEDTISLHVDSNPAWVCAEISNIAQTENGCNPPEAKVDTTCDTPGPGQGELWDNLTFSIWMDNGAGTNSCNNIKDTDETYLIENAKATNLKWPIADSQHGIPITDACVGVAWSVPSAVGNIIQGDSVTGDITFNAYQARNNDNFLCKPPVCGNGNIDPGEECDGDVPQACVAAGGYQGLRTCTQCIWSSCEPTEWCGDGKINDAEQCDGTVFIPPYDNGHYTCNASCIAIYQSYCGDGKLDAGEQCDDGNTNPNDGCSATCQTEYAYLIVHKDVVNNDVGTKNPGNFQMTIDTVNAAQDVAISVAANVSHAVSEADAFGYTKTYSGDCDTNGNVTVAYNQTKTCNVKNEFPVFTITVNKVVNNTCGGNAVTGNFSLFVDATGVTSGVSKKVSVGTHFISESGVIGYTAVFSGDCDPSTQMLTGNNGDNKTCTITNTDICPVITLVKSVVGGALPTDFIMRIDGGVPVPTGSSKLVTSNAPHTINEDAKAGYNFTSMAGTGTQGSLCPAALGGTVTLNEGEVITCTITNTVIP